MQPRLPERSSLRGHRFISTQRTQISLTSSDSPKSYVLRLSVNTDLLSGPPKRKGKSIVTLKGNSEMLRET